MKCGNNLKTLQSINTNIQISTLIASALIYNLVFDSCREEKAWYPLIILGFKLSSYD
jgi:hypothetical protein